MLISMEQFISKTARSMSNYHPYDDSWSAKLRSLDFPALDQVIVGIYHDGTIYMVFTDTHLYYLEGIWTPIEYISVQSVHIKEGTKDTASTLIVQHNEIITELSIQSSNGKFRDIFPLVRVLNRVVQKAAMSK